MGVEMGVDPSGNARAELIYDDHRHPFLMQLVGMARTRSLVQHDKTTGCVNNHGRSHHRTSRCPGNLRVPADKSYAGQPQRQPVAESGRNPEATRTLHRTHPQTGGPQDPNLPYPQSSLPVIKCIQIGITR